MRRVGLIDIKVGNACASAHRNVPPRDAVRRTTSLRNASCWDIPAALARLAGGPGTIDTKDYCSKRKWFLMMVYQEKIAPPNSLPVLASEPSDVLRSQRTIESLELENAWLKERLARIIRSQIAK